MTDAAEHLEDDAFVALALAALEGRCSESEHAQLAAMLTADAARRRQFNRLSAQLYLLQQRATVTAAEPPKPDLSHPGALRAKVRVSPEVPRSEFRVPRWSYPLAAALLLAAAAAAIYVFVINPGPKTRDAQSNRPIATVLDADDGSTITINDTIANVGDEIRSGVLTLDAGSADFRMSNGVNIRLTGETRLVVRGPMSAILARGTATFDCPKGVTGYTVELPGNARLVDIGTAFAVHVAGDGTTQVYVIDGAVEVQTPGTPDVNRRVIRGGGFAQIEPGEAAVDTAGTIPSASPLAAFADPVRVAGQVAIVHHRDELAETNGLALIAERRAVTLSKSVMVQVTETGPFSYAARKNVSLPTGETVDSYLLVLAGRKDGGVIKRSGSVTFDRPIRGVAIDYGDLHKGDAVFGLRDFDGTPARLGNINDGDLITLGDDRRTLTVTWSVIGEGVDRARIFVQSAPTPPGPKSTPVETER